MEMADSANGNTAVVEFTRDRNLTIYQRIHATMQDVGHLEKDKKMQGGKMSYEYISHDAVAAAARVPFIRYGVIVQPIVTRYNTDGNRIELSVTVDFINIDNPKDRIPVSVVSYGVDNSDKGPGKALSYAVKYATLKLLMLNSADDIEEDDTPHDASVARQSLIHDAQDATRDARESWANALRDAIDGATTTAQIDEMQRAHKSTLMAVPAVTRDWFITRFETRKTELAK